MAGAEKEVLPGDEVAIAEEFMTGDGTYEEAGKVYASVAGCLVLDTKERIARIRPYNRLAILEVGDIVYGFVTDIKVAMAVVVIGKKHGSPREITGETEGAIHISKIAEGYVRDVGSELRFWDIVRAKVIQALPSVQLTTQGANLGVIRALCARCRTTLERKGGQLWCPLCERTETRKLASDYGFVESC